MFFISKRPPFNLRHNIWSETLKQRTRDPLALNGKLQCGSSSDSHRCVPPRQPQGPICHRQAPHLGHLCVRSKNASMLPGHLRHCRYAIASWVGWRHLCAPSLSTHLSIQQTPLFSYQPPCALRIHITMFGFSILRLTKS